MQQKNTFTKINTMKKLLLTVMILMGVIVCNAQSQKVKTTPVKPVPGQTPPQAPPKQPAPQMIKPTVKDSIKNKKDSSKIKIKPNSIISTKNRD
jgi:uncharacterized lipoprotein YajG